MKDVIKIYVVSFVSIAFVVIKFIKFFILIQHP